MNDRNRILTGVRPAGPPHVGHYAGAIESWLTSQHEHDCYFHIADWRVSDHAGGALPRVRSAVWDVALDWLAAALDPERSSFVSECPVKAARVVKLGDSTVLAGSGSSPTRPWTALSRRAQCVVRESRRRRLAVPRRWFCCENPGHLDDRAGRLVGTAAQRRLHAGS